MKIQMCFSSGISSQHQFGVNHVEKEMFECVCGLVFPGRGERACRYFGDMVNVTYRTNGDVDLGDRTIVSGGTLFASGYENVTIDDSTIEILIIQSWEPTAGSSYVITDLSQDFPGTYHLTSSSFLDSSDIATVGNTLTVSLSELNIAMGSTALLTLTPVAAVPEAESYAMLSAGLGLLCMVCRRMKRAKPSNRPGFAAPALLV
ncbi:hypothetical protein GT347_06100 [Xylophilus rhododendri]|uniref:PEP-CTERM protein-sorting domain-containing protein n=1 Tax=Xylophilus rhododendri TaxID=2697032 RepID=A0A857J1W2_9BURK|nr:PEP-CTERM sorting domain-containing protein [Xylophilus rhododendri]QHI97597.1 hypothetical protein GT347_06100 [Xylophilus rhododendri]